MTHWNQTPLEAATELIENGITLEKYQEIQNRRIERYNFWKERGIHAMAEVESKLIKFGNAVIDIMKKSSTNNDISYLP